MNRYYQNQADRLFLCYNAYFRPKILRPVATVYGWKYAYIILAFNSNRMFSAMPSKKVCIVVPIYLEEPTALEKIGLAQILKVFKNYDIIFQVSNGIQTKWYEEFSQGKANFQFREFAVNNFI